MPFPTGRAFVSFGVWASEGRIEVVVHRKVLVRGSLPDDADEVVPGLGLVLVHHVACDLARSELALLPGCKPCGPRLAWLPLPRPTSTMPSPTATPTAIARTR